MTLDRDKLAKVLALTTSSSDGEALAAARRANAMLDRAGLRWADVLAGPGGSAAGTRSGSGTAGGGRRWAGFQWTTAAVQKLSTADQAELVEDLLRPLQRDRSDAAARYLSGLRAELRDSVRSCLSRRQAETVADLGRVMFG